MAEAETLQLEHVAQDVKELKGDMRQVKEGLNALAQRLSRLEGLFEQMNQRMANLEQTQRWGLGLWAVLVLAVLGLYFKG